MTAAADLVALLASHHGFELERGGDGHDYQLVRDGRAVVAGAAETIRVYLYGWEDARKAHGRRVALTHGQAVALWATMLTVDPRATGRAMHDQMIDLAESEAMARGYQTWIAAAEDFAPAAAVRSS